MSIDPHIRSSIITLIPKSGITRALALFLFGAFLFTEASRRRVHNVTIILSSTPDSDSSKRTRAALRKDQKPYQKKHAPHAAAFLLYELTPAALLLLIPLSVHAGFFSKMMGVFADEVVAQVSLEEIDHSPTQTPLLSATKNPDPLKAVGGGDVFYEDGVLVSTGPIGEDEISASSMNRGEISVYTVNDEGETLSQIAQMYGVTVNTIVWANNLTSATDIHPGDTLVILPIVGVRHTVAKGETLNSIVKKYGADLDEVLEYNNLASTDDLAVGDELMIPGGELHTASKKVAGTVTPTKTTGAVSSGAGFTHPLPGARRTQGIHGYNGVDLAASAGTGVLAAAGGEVIVAKSSGWNGGYGNYVVIKHKNTQTLYAHLSSVSVGVGDVVSSGEMIGVIGNTGKSTGIHLHFEVRGGTNPF